MSKSLLRRIPWQARILAKIVLSRLPVPFDVWRRLALFKHGSMNRADYVWFVFGRHLEDERRPGGLAGKTLLELGPGDGIATGLLASCLGAERTYLVDAGDFASRDVADYEAMIQDWASRGLPVEHLRGCATREELCAAARIEYGTQGLASLRAIPTDAVDLQISNAVLEHVRLGELDATLRELARILHPEGEGRHAVDLNDHLGGGLNNLRFSERRWESPLFADSGFYTNRVRLEEMLTRMRRAGFEAELGQMWRWDDVPLARAKMEARFRGLSDEELCVRGFDVALRVAAAQETASDEIPAALPRRERSAAESTSERAS